MNQETKVALLLGGGFLLVGILLGQLQNNGEKKSHFVDEELSEAEGKMDIPSGAAKQKYRPNSWTKVGKNWIWVNAEGNLVITDGQ